MNQRNRERVSCKNNQQIKNKSNTHFRSEKWLKLINRNKFGYLTATVMTLTLLVKILSPAKLALSQSLISNSLENQTKETLILAQEEREREPEGESTERERESEGESAERERESEGEPAERERESEGESAERERESEGEPAERERESEGESAERERESERESAERERESEEEGESEEELSFEEEKKALEENIDEHYEEWESRKAGVRISHSLSAVTTIVLTIVITLIGTGLFVIPSGRLIVLVLGLITVLIQLNSNIFILKKSLAGYRIVEEQGNYIKEQLEYVKTEKELRELKELFRELTLEALTLE